MKPILEVKNISKTFPGVKALDRVNLSLFPGEVHILAGENGAGKSTLIKCILGIYSADEGEIYYKGEEVSPSFMRAKVAAVHQELSMVPYLDAAQNIFFCKEPRVCGTPVLNTKTMYKEAKEILHTLHCDSIPLQAPVKSLGVASQQMIEIAKAMVAKPEILIFDEPTAALSEREVEFLFEQIEVLKNQGIAILYISHRMGEFYRIGDRVTILRDGCWVHSGALKELSEEQLTGLMVGRSFSWNLKGRGDETRKADRSPFSHSGELLLKADHLQDCRGKVRDASLEVGRGEIVGIAGLVGSGRTEFARLLYGMDKPSSGSLLFKGKNMTGKSPGDMVEAGLGFLTEDRKQLGLALDAPISWNMVAASLKKYFPNGILSEKKNCEIADAYVKQLRIATPDSQKKVNQLSGGNQQKVVIGKWLAADTDLLIFDEPTKGVDIGAKMEIYQLIHQLAENGKGVLVISSEMEELIRLSDKIYVMNQGYMSSFVEREDFDMQYIGKRMWAETSDFTKQMYEESSDSTKQMYEESSVSTRQRCGSASKRLFDPIRNMISHLPPALVITAILMLIFSLKVDHYFTFSNFSGVCSQAAPLLVVACGQTIIVLLQGTDLSLGAMLSVIGVSMILFLQMGLPLPVVLFLCLVLGTLMGLLNGVIAGRLLLPIFIVTLGTQNIFRSVALLLSGSQTLYADTSFFRQISKTTFLGFTWSVWIALACLIFTIFLLRKTTFGMRVKGLGGNEEAITFAGRSVARQKILAFAYAGFMASIGGILLCCRIESGNPVCGNGMEFNSIAAVLIGGTSMREGRGGAVGTLFGVILIQILKSGLTQTGISSIYQNAIIGIVVLGAIMFDAYLKKVEKDRRG